MFVRLEILLIIILLSVVFIPLSVHSQTTQSEQFVVDSVKISGNESTEEFIIRRELNFVEGDTLNQNTLDYNKERVYSLGIFNFVDITSEGVDNKRNVLITVKEAWYIYSIPFYRIVNNRSRYGVRVVWKNFRGRNEKLSAMVSLGYNPYYLVTYANPVLSKDYDLSLAASSVYQRVGNPSVITKDILGGDFEYKFISNYLALGKRINQYNSIGFALGYTYAETEYNYGFNTTASKSRIDRFPYLWTFYTYDTRDLKQYAMVGTYAYLSFSYKGFGSQDISYSVVNVDLRKYAPLVGSLGHKCRLAMRHSGGAIVPVYDKSYLGYKNFIRGHKDDISEGDNIILMSYELDLPIIEEWDLELDLPLIPKKLTSARIGIHITAYTDFGAAFNSNTYVGKMKFEKGWGLGINLLFLPHNGLRFEYAWNEFGKGELLIGTGLSF